MIQREGPGLGGSAPGADAPPSVAGGAIVRVFQETPDVILMLQVSADGFLRCQTAISSFPTAPSLPALQGLVIEQILPPEVLSRFGTRYEEATKRKGPVRYEEHLRVGDSDVVLDAAVTPIFDKGGAVTHLFWSARNVTDQWTTAESLRQTEERLQALEREHAGLLAQRDAGLVDPALEELRRELEQRGAEVERLREEAEARERALAERERSLEEQRGALDERVRAFEQREAEIREREAGLQEREAGLEERVRALDEERRSIQEKEGSHDEQRKALDELRAELEAERASIDVNMAELEASRSQLQEETEELRRAREELERATKDLEEEKEGLEKRVAELEREASTVEERAGELEREREALASDRETLETEREALRVLKDALGEERRALEQEREGLETERQVVVERLEEAEGSEPGHTGHLFREAAIGLAWSDGDAKLLEANGAFAAIVGRPAEDLASISLKDLAHDDDQDAIARLISEAQEAEARTARSEIRLSHEEEGTRYVHVTVNSLPEEERLLWQVLDYTERRGLQERLAHQALHDALTGLPNRALFLDRLSRALQRLDRNPGTVAVMVMDLDRFAEVNERNGNEVGDRVLAHVGELLADSIRASDTVGRLESDRFGILCEELGDDEDAQGVADRLRRAVEGTVVVEGIPIEVQVSMGVALTQETNERPETLLRDATLAMREAKDAGRGRTEIFDRERREQTAQRLRTESDLARGIEEDEFRVFYQPQIDLESGRIVGVEVLVRWQQPDRGIVTPSEFIPLAEESGLIVPLGRWILEQASLQSKRWASVGGTPLTTWINMSPRQLAQPDLPEMVDKVISETGADPATLCVEVTEGVLLEETGHAIANLRGLKELGLRVGIDDFGKGFSSLAYLKRLPVDMLKVDQAFVQGLGQSKEDSAIVAAVINLARAMELTSIAEGVETPEQLARLRELGCELAQGYLFASPQPAEVVEQLLTQDLRW